MNKIGHWAAEVVLILLVTLSMLSSAAPSCSYSTRQARVTDIYPTIDILPENLLRFYIYFSMPMQREDLFSSIRLVDENGNLVNGAFLRNKFDLWSPDGKCLTLLFDPGRVKTGLVAHEARGRALQANHQYHLIIEDSLKDLNGCPLIASHQKSLQVVAADTEAPDIQKWNLEAPISHTRDALMVSLNGSHDHVSMAYRMRIKDRYGNIVPGRIDLANQEQKWLFAPDEPWQSDTYKLIIDPTLEDIAGNRITGLFEEPLKIEHEEHQFGWPEIAFRPVDSTNE